MASKSVRSETIFLTKDKPAGHKVHFQMAVSRLKFTASHASLRLNTSSGRWTRSWCGRRTSGAKSSRSTRTCTTPTFRKSLGPGGRKWAPSKNSPTTKNRPGCPRHTCKNIQTTNTNPGPKEPASTMGRKWEFLNIRYRSEFETI